MTAKTVAEDLKAVTPPCSLYPYLNRVMDGYVKYLPENIIVVSDGCPYVIMRDGVMTEYSDDFIAMFKDTEEKDYVKCQMNIDIGKKTVFIGMDRIDGRVSSNLETMFDAQRKSYGEDVVISPVDVESFLRAKMIGYMNKFGKQFPYDYIGDAPETMIARINVCVEHDVDAETFFGETKDPKTEAESEATEPFAIEVSGSEPEAESVEDEAKGCFQVDPVAKASVAKPSVPNASNSADVSEADSAVASRSVPNTFEPNTETNVGEPSGTNSVTELKQDILSAPKTRKPRSSAKRNDTAVPPVKKPGSKTKTPESVAGSSGRKSRTKAEAKSETMSTD